MWVEFELSQVVRPLNIINWWSRNDICSVCLPKFKLLKLLIYFFFWDWQWIWQEILWFSVDKMKEYQMNGKFFISLLLQCCRIDWIYRYCKCALCAVCLSAELIPWFNSIFVSRFRSVSLLILICLTVLKFYRKSTANNSNIKSQMRCLTSNFPINWILKNAVQCARCTSNILLCWLRSS